MRTKLRGKVTLLSIMCAVLIAIPAIAALADTLTVSNALVVNTNTTKNPGDTGTANVWLETTNGTPANDPNGCNASTAAGQAVTVTLSSNNTAVTFPNGNTAQITACGSTNAKQISYKVADNASAGTATISANATGGKSGQTNLYNTTDTLIVTINAPADSTAPVITQNVTPATPDGSNGWYKSNVSVSYTVTDPDSTITSKSSYCDSTT